MWPIAVYVYRCGLMTTAEEKDERGDRAWDRKWRHKGAKKKLHVLFGPVRGPLVFQLGVSTSPGK